VRTKGGRPWLREHQRTNSRPLPSGICMPEVDSVRVARSRGASGGSWRQGVSFCAKLVALPLFGGGPPDRIKRPDSGRLYY
jgi:hypothetical protein